MAVDPFAWLGLRKSREANAHLSAVHEVVRELLPKDEPVVVRYIVVVAIFLTRVAHADGRVVAAERERLRALFTHIDRMPPDAIDDFCDVLDRCAPKLSRAEIGLCYGEIKSLCDAKERHQVLRLLARQASADGDIHIEEHRALLEIATKLGVAAHVVDALEHEALHGMGPGVRPQTIPPAPD